MMLSETNQPMPTTSEPAEPRAARRAVPVWLLVLLFVLIYWGFVYFDQRSAWGNVEVYAPYRSLEEVDRYQPPTGGLDPRGKLIFENNCALCHNSDGTGKPNQAPPFVASEWVLGSPNRLIRIPLVGLAGPVMVAGKEYNLTPMAPMGASLPDADLAAVLSYIRQSWGNKAAPITAEQVKAVRAALGNRNQPETAAELIALP
jgi:mono/diheme cytochrome c family protein